MKTDIHFLSYLAQCFLELEMFQTNVVQEIKTHISCLVIFFFENHAFFLDNMETFCRTGQATDGNMAHAH